MREKDNYIGKRWGLKPQAVILLSLVPLGILIAGACTHVLLAILLDINFGWGVFALWLAALVSATLFWMLISWRVRHQFDSWLQLLVLDAGGTFLWYWAFAPLYQYLLMNFSAEQSAVNAFAFFWEVPLVGGLACLFSQWQFRPLAKYMRTGRTNQPEKLYHYAEALPFKVIVRNSIAATLGFTIGALQIDYLLGMSSIELAKDVALGFVVSIFVSLYYFLVFYILIGPIKSKLVSQYKLKNVTRAKYHFRVVVIIVMITLGSLLLMANLYVNNFQKSVRETLVSDAGRRLDTITNESQLNNQAVIDSLKFGTNGSVYTIPADGELPIKEVSRTTTDAYSASSSGWIQDEGAKPKLIGYKIIGDQKVITIIYVNDFYGPLWKTFQSLAIGATLVLAATIGAALIFVRVLARTLRELDEAVAHARKTGDYHANIDTGDEFEAISRSFGHFVNETKKHSQELNEEHARLEASLYSLQLGMIITELDGNIININESAEKILFRRPIKAQNIDDIENALPQKLQIKESIENSIKTNKPVHIENVVFGAKFLDVVISPILTQSKQVIGTITVLQDVTEAQVLQRSRDEFFSIASHELRTPLTAIRGNAQMIQQFYEPIMKKNPDLSEMVSDMHNSSVRLIDIVNDFLDVSRLDQGKVTFKLEAFALDRTIESVIYDMQASMRAKGLTLTVNKKTLGALPHVWADEQRTKQVLYNLIGNASKFTNEGGVTIDAMITNSMIKVTISDTGPGIPIKMQKLLFHKFQQAGESILTRDGTRGTGLGLYISKSIIEGMGGRIALESSVEGKGSTFSFTVPIATKKRIKVDTPINEIDSATGLTK